VHFQKLYAGVVGGLSNIVELPGSFHAGLGRGIRPVAGKVEGKTMVLSVSWGPFRDPHLCFQSNVLKTLRKRGESLGKAPSLSVYQKPLNPKKKKKTKPDLRRKGADPTPENSSCISREATEA